MSRIALTGVRLLSLILVPAGCYAGLVAEGALDRASFAGLIPRSDWPSLHWDSRELTYTLTIKNDPDVISCCPSGATIPSKAKAHLKEAQLTIQAWAHWEFIGSVEAQHGLTIGSDLESGKSITRTDKFKFPGDFKVMPTKYEVKDPAWEPVIGAAVFKPGGTLSYYWYKTPNSKSETCKTDINPEPGTCFLMLTGGVLLGVRAWGGRRHGKSSLT
ncbi:MAG: hypothetical protein NTY38_29855 [Acidobacteria bacterium]|nr:hypothetical protein [Acidobacteriota bacterium]